MTTSILAENTVTKKMESNVVNHSSESITNLFTGLDELLKQLSDEIAKHESIYDVPRRTKSPEPIYDVPRTTNAYDPIAALSTYDYLKPTESHSDVSKSLASRPLPPLPVPSLVEEPIYEEIFSFKPAKAVVKNKTSLHQAKIHLFKSLQHCLRSLKKVFVAIRSNQSNNYMKTLQDAINTDPVLDQKIMLDLAEFKYATLGSPESLADLIQHLENVIFALEGRVAASMKVSHSREYGDILSDKLKQPMEIAKLDLDQAKARLVEVKGLETALALTNTASTQAPVSVANNRFALFGKTVSTTTMVENPLYDSLDVIKGMTRSAG